MADMTFKVNLLPNSDLGYSLGSSDKRWKLNGNLTGYSLNILYGTCATAAGTAAKVVTLNDTTLTSLTLTTGMMLGVKFTNKNTASNPTITLKSDTTTLSSGTSIARYGTTAPGTAASTSWRDGAMVLFVYDGTRWVESSSIDSNDNTNTLLRTYTGNANNEYPLLAQNSSANATSAWTEYTSSYKDYYGVIPNSSSTRATINLSTGKITVPGGIVANITGNVSGNAGTVNSHTVNADVPADAVFTDVDRYVNSATFADNTSTDTSNPVLMTLTRAGSDSATVTASIPKVSSSSAGVAPKGAAVSTQSQTTKFLREDGSWAAPSYTTSVSLSDVSGTSDLQAIEALSGTSGFLKKTAADTWALESSLLYIASYGSSTWQEILNAYNENRVIYCRAGTGTTPGASSKPRMAFLAYVNNPTNPTSFEFQYYRSLNAQSRSETAQGDEVYTYTITSSNQWSYSVRKAYTEINVAANSGLASSYSDTSGNYKLSLSLDTAYGDTINPYGSKTQKYVLAAPTNANGIPEFRALTTSDISGYSSGVTSVSWDSTNGLQQSVDGGTASTIVSPSSLISDLGLSTAMHFRGIATVTITDGSTTDPTIPNYSFGTNGANAQAGDVIIDSSSAYEYVWTGSAWERLGGDSSYALSDHTHGKITNDGKIASSDNVTIGNNDRLIISDSSDSYLLKNSSIVFGTSETQALTNKGTWKSFSYVELNGSANTAPSFYAPTAVGSNGNFLKSSGSGAPSWVSITEADISDFGSYKTTQTAVSDDTTTPTTSATTFVSAVTQDTNGVITVTKKNLPIATDQAKGIMQVGTGLSVSSGTVSVSYGTTANTAAAGNHTHGNLTNDGKVGSTADYAVYTTTGGAITAGSLAFTDPTASSTTSTTFIDTVSQNSKGQITATKKTLPVASTSTAGIIQIGTGATNAAAGNHTHNEYVTDIDWTYDSSQGALASANGITQSKNGGTAQVVISQEELQQAIFIISATEPTDTNVIWLKPIS